MPRVFNIKDENIPRSAIYVGRGTLWGNPFKIGKDGTRNEVCERFEREILPTLDVSELRGKDLICHCFPKRCHATSLLKKANSIFFEKIA